MRRPLYLSLFLLGLALLQPVKAQPSPILTRLATDLNNPRGIVVLAEHQLIVAEAGSGRGHDGQLSLLQDLNGDGLYEKTVLQANLPSYNAYVDFNPGRDEVLGIGDVLLLDDGRILYTLDDHFENIHIMAFRLSDHSAERFARGVGSLNTLAYDPERQLIYVAESSLNMLSSFSLEGRRGGIAEFPTLANGQQAVPAGLALDPQTGDVLVALFSGQLFDYYGTLLSYMPLDAKVVRVNPRTGAITDEIVGLTTAIDVAIDEGGNIFVLEMATRWPPPPLFRPFDLYDAASPPDDGGYPRFSGRVTLYPSDASPPIRLADGLDTPTNLTYHEGALYVSTGQGTPTRSIIGADGLTQIRGEIYRITGY